MTEPALVPDVGRFRIRRFLGRGAMGDVYLAFDPELEEEVALKVIRKSQADSDVLEAESRGAELQKRVSTMAPQVATVHEYGDLGDLFYVSMEFVDGTDLLDVLRQAGGRPIDAQRTIDLGFQLCEILEVLHGFSTEVDGKMITSIIHGDIKPENLRLQDDDRLRMLDFGVAKHLSLTRKATHNLFGSYPYAPPERLRTGLVDERSDLWAAGVILYVMATGRQPYTGKTPEELERQICSTPPLPLPPECAPGLRAVIERALAFDPAQRYPSAAGIRDDLRALREGRPPAPYLVDRVKRSEEAGAGADDLEQTRRTVAPEEEDTEATRRSLLASNSAGGTTPSDEPADLEATRRTQPPSLPPPPPWGGAASPGSPARDTSDEGESGSDALPGPPRNLAGRLERRWRGLSPRWRRWLVIAAAVFVVAQFFAQAAARDVVREVNSEAAPDVASALAKYRGAARVRPFDLGLGKARKKLRAALVADAERVIARFRGDTPTAVKRDWVRSRDHLAAALELHGDDPATTAKLHYCQAQVDRIRARSLKGEGKEGEAQRLWDDAIFGFERAAELDTGWPDPYLGLARIYAYEQLDLERLQDTLESALSRGHAWGARDRAQLADAHTSLGLRALAEATALRGQRPERERLYDAQRHFELAAAGYERILSFGNARKNRNAVLKRLDELRDRLRQLRRI